MIRRDMAHPDDDPTAPRVRYDYRTIADEIHATIARAPYGTKAACARALDIHRGDFNHFLAQRRTTENGKGQRFDYEQIGVIAQVVGEKLGRPQGAPRGWPFIPWDEAERFEGFLAATAGLRA